MKQWTLLDGDVYAYRSASSCNPTKAKPFQESEDVALARLEDMIRRTLLHTDAVNYKCFLGGPTNFRKEIYPQYKANRKDTPKPMWLSSCRDYLIKYHKAQVTDGIEADDELGIEQTAHQLDSIICTNDKDLRTVPGWHYHAVNQTIDLVTPFEALRSFYSQVLLGDMADNIPGYDGKLRVKAPQFMDSLMSPLQGMTEEMDMYEHCKQVYLDNNNTEDLMHRNCQLLYILRQEGQYWQPPERENQLSGPPLEDMPSL